MRRFGWQSWGLALAAALAIGPADARSAADEPPNPGEGPAYEALGRMAVLHQGRVKPLDTLARQMIKQIYGAETIKLVDDRGEVTAAWGHVGAFFDIQARPEFWDEQPILRVDHLGLKQKVLAAPIRDDLNALAAKDGTPESTRDRLRSLADPDAGPITAGALTAVAQEADLPQADRVRLAAWADRLGGERRWLGPKELEEARIEVDGRPVAFNVWVADIAGRSEGGMAQRAQLPEIERKAYDAGIALRHYQGLRGDHVAAMDLDLFTPRPSNEAYLKYAGEAYTTVRDQAHAGPGGEPELSELRKDTLSVLIKYFDNLQRDDWKTPGTDPDFDRRFAGWLREKAAWVPTHLLLETDPAELEKAGFPIGPVSAYREAHRAAVDAESEAPGNISLASADGLADAARRLGEAVGGYPAPEAVGREVHFNAFAPFYKSAYGYAIGMVLLTLSLGVPIRGRSAVGLLGGALYAGGLTAFVAGIALEVYGFYHRVRISGWAPVTNMYETVIWVALVSAVLGLVLEAIYRRTYAALAATGVAFLGTLLAYKVPLLDGEIKSLTPVLRSNYWLSIHVLTIVSSYAAFALAMGLGLIGTGIYLTATYRRTPGFGSLARPLLAGLPLLALGACGVYGSYRGIGPAWLSGLYGYFAAAGVAGLGGILTIVGLGAVAGEAVARFRFRGEESGPSIATEPAHEMATVARPSAAEIRARAAEAGPVVVVDTRERAMQATAARIKPLSNFIYRAMQVGVLLCASGTILGGLWADVSWGRFWGWDPKEVWALITLLVYLIPLHGRFAGWVNTFTLVAASVACFSSVVMAWYGVNFVLGVGLHSYGFGEGGGQGSVLAVCTAVLSVVGAAWWRRRLAQVVAA